MTKCAIPNILTGQKYYIITQPAVVRWLWWASAYQNIGKSSSQDGSAMIKVMSNTGKLHYTKGIRSQNEWRTLCGKTVKILLYECLTGLSVNCLTCNRIRNKERNV